MNRTEILAEARNDLTDPLAGTWTDAQLNKYLNKVIRQMSRRLPLEATACLKIEGLDVNISHLTQFVRHFRVEYPVGNSGNSPMYIKGKKVGDIIQLDLSAQPTITAGVLAGTVTFTKGSRTVTGSGTAFTVLEEGINGYLICPSTGSRWYQVYKVASATSLTLAEPFDETTITDTVDVTMYRDRFSCVRLHYGKEYTVDLGPAHFEGSGLNDITLGSVYNGSTDKIYRVKITTAAATDKFKWSTDGGTTWSSEANCAVTASTLELGVTVLWAAAGGHTLNEYWEFRARPNDMPFDLNDIAVLGVAANAAMDYAANFAQARLAGIGAQITSAAAACANVSARITQALADLTSGRGLITGGFTTTLASIDTALGQVTTDLTSARAKVPTNNRGGDEANKYTELAKADIAQAQSYLDKALAYCSQKGANYTEFAAQELASAQRYVDQAAGYAQIILQTSQTAQLVSSYRTSAREKMDKYEKELNKLGRVDDSNDNVMTRDSNSIFDEWTAY